ncbi:CIC11C00000004254 [Sungouiella intermedia]|uniref:CIC11C00000004254 n=1 Tax=Sungouiella intermedia TaxID=45354 RepID=A0A1L0DC13_9ASCO|nr:CIC11C00000004254 [[Candida] intermedia]
MYINPAQYALVFQEIKRSSSSHSTCRLILFVSCLSIDSICTAKILSLVLKKSLIQYQLIPVVGYADLKEHYQRLDVDVANIILIGCGAMIDIEAFFEIDVNEYVSEQAPDVTQSLYEDLDKAVQKSLHLRRKIYIIDGNRPWNLDNVFGSEMVVCFDDGYIDKNLQKERASYRMLVDASDHESDDEDQEDDSDSDSDNEDEVEEIAVGSGEELDNDENEDSRKRKHEDDAKRLHKQRRKALHSSESLLETYYNQGTAIFTATTAITYALLATIGETSIDNLWLSIIGVSSLDRLHSDVYDKIVPLFKEEVHRLNPSNSSGSSSERTADSNTLAIEKDYHLFLLRHWTLYDSFFYSSLVNSKLNLWTEDGKKKLHKLFAKWEYHFPWLNRSGYTWTSQ